MQCLCAADHIRGHHPNPPCTRTSVRTGFASAGNLTSSLLSRGFGSLANGDPTQREPEDKTVTLTLTLTQFVRTSVTQTLTQTQLDLRYDPYIQTYIQFRFCISRNFS